MEDAAIEPVPSQPEISRLAEVKAKLLSLHGWKRDFSGFDYSIENEEHKTYLSKYKGTLYIEGEKICDGLKDEYALLEMRALEEEQIRQVKLVEEIVTKFLAS